MCDVGILLKLSSYHTEARVRLLFLHEMWDYYDMIQEFIRMSRMAVYGTFGSVLIAV